MEHSAHRIVRSPISRADLSAIAATQFGDLVKAAVDVERVVMVTRAELRSDA
jgi:hypothetical protein